MLTLYEEQGTQRNIGHNLCVFRTILSSKSITGCVLVFLNILEAVKKDI